MENSIASWENFTALDIRVGTIIKTAIFKESKKPAYKVWVDFGPLGIKKSSAQITTLYSVEDLVGKQVIAILNFTPKQIANIKSECLILGAVDGKDITLLTTDKPTPNGLKIG
ncbi:MAG: tRNA-binding protein [Luteibaculaceae bacterium]